MNIPISERKSRHNVKQLRRARLTANRIGGTRGALYLVNAMVRFKEKASAKDRKELTWFLVR